MATALPPMTAPLRASDCHSDGLGLPPSLGVLHERDDGREGEAQVGACASTGFPTASSGFPTASSASACGHLDAPGSGVDERDAAACSLRCTRRELDQFRQRRRELDQFRQRRRELDEFRQRRRELDEFRRRSLLGDCNPFWALHSAQHSAQRALRGRGRHGRRLGHQALSPPDGHGGRCVGRA